MHEGIEGGIEFIFKDIHMESNWYEPYSSPTKIREPLYVGNDLFGLIDAIDGLYVLI
jgi:hypothetical protein